MSLDAWCLLGFLFCFSLMFRQDFCTWVLEVGISQWSCLFSGSRGSVKIWTQNGFLPLSQKWRVLFSSLSSHSGSSSVPWQRLVLLSSSQKLKLCSLVGGFREGPEVSCSGDLLSSLASWGTLSTRFPAGPLCSRASWGTLPYLLP